MARIIVHVGTMQSLALARAPEAALDQATRIKRRARRKRIQRGPIDQLGLRKGLNDPVDVGCQDEPTPRPHGPNATHIPILISIDFDDNQKK